MVIKNTTHDVMLGCPEIQSMLPSLTMEGFPFDDLVNLIRTFEVYSIGDTGYFISKVSNVEGCKECHAFILPSQRNKSIKALKALIAFVKEQGYDVYTTVTGDYPYILRLLKMIGFSVVKVEECALSKDGISYPLFHLTNNNAQVA
ncbi:MAG: hypothetical protein ACRDCE_22890 [Cetobacterium sp.]|uniref:hypothetical protein n=1 Tax=Cetobacterium sp. TaxID=2071632 RepID=UPI003EE54E90